MPRKRPPADPKVKIVDGKLKNINRILTIKQTTSGEKPKVTLPRMSWDK